MVTGLWTSGYSIQGLGQSSGFRVQSLGFGAQALGLQFRV